MTLLPHPGASDRRKQITVKVGGKSDAGAAHPQDVVIGHEVELQSNGGKYQCTLLILILGTRCVGGRYGVPSNSLVGLGHPGEQVLAS